MDDASGSKETTEIDSVDPQFVAEVEIDLTRIRARITDLSTESINVAAEILKALEPLHRQVVDVIDLSRSADAERSDTGDRSAVELSNLVLSQR